MATTKPKLSVGQRIFNGGDMANPEHFGTIIHVTDDQWGVQYRIEPDGEERGRYTVSAAMISPEYKGHGGTRIVTEEAYRTWQAKALAELQRKAR